MTQIPNVAPKTEPAAIIVNETGEPLPPGARAEAKWAKPNELHERWHWAIVKVLG